MKPEDLMLELEPDRVRRILRKLLGKLGDLEEEVTLRPSVYGSRAQREGEAQGTGRIPPAHPFEAQLLQNARRQPRYTYKRRRCSSSGNSSDGTDEVAAVRTRSNGGGGPLSRSASLGALSDSDMSSSGQDPALWLTTPRKRLKRRQAVGGIDAAAGAQEQSFAERLETLIVRPTPRAVNTYKAKCLVTHMTHLGEMLWLGSPVSNAGQGVRALPLRALAAFRLGEAIACTADFSDLDYLDEMYGSIPAFSVRLVLWQHVTTLCYLRAPAYADALSEALWQVGAFAQQDWLINARMEDLQPASALLRPENIAPLHLRSIDIGTEPRFIDRLLSRLAALRRAGLGADGEVVANSLWLQFVSAGTVPNISAASDDEDRGVKGLRRTYSSDSGLARLDADKVVMSRYAKWVARISDPVQSVRILAAALEDALDFALGRAAERDGGSEATDVYVSMAAQAVKTTCSIIYTRLGGATTDAFSGYGDVAIGRVRRCIDLLARLSGVCADQTGPGARVSRDASIQAEVGEVSAVCQTGLVLLALRQLGAEQPALVGMAKRLMKRLCEGKRAVPPKDVDGALLSKRKAIAARFDVLCEASLNLSHCRAEPPLEGRLFEAVVQPLAVAGASPEALLDVSRLVAGGVGRPGMARAIASATLARLEAIWAHHHKCREWQHGWSRLYRWSAQQAAAATASKSGAWAEDVSDEELLARRALRRQLEDIASAPDQRRSGPPAGAGRGKAASTRRSIVRTDIAEDEIGLLLVRGRSRGRHSATAAHIQSE